MCNRDPYQTVFNRTSVSFSRFISCRGKGNLHTFEFRQMAGCLDPGPIMHWARVCIALVDFARLSDAVAFRGLVEKILKGRGTTFTAFDLLRELGLVEEEKYFRQSVAGYKTMFGLYPGAEAGKLFLDPME